MVMRLPGGEGVKGGVVKGERFFSVLDAQIATPVCRQKR